jgi:uncharacterized protein (TIRG00374 family)
MKRNILLISLTFLIAGAILYFVFDEIGTKEIWEAFLSFSPWGIFWILILTVLFHLTAVWRWQAILKDKGYNLSSRILMPAWLAGFATAYFTPVAIMGDGALRGYVLKEKFSIPWKKGIISVLIDKVLDGTIFFLTIILGIIFFILETLTIPLKLWMIFLVILLPIGGISFFYFRAFKSQSMVKLVERPLKKFIHPNRKESSNEVQDQSSSEVFNWEKEIFNFFEPKNRNMWKAIIFSSFRGIVNWSRSWLLLWFLGIKVNGLTCLSIVAFTNLAYFFPLPAALGSHEALQAFSFSQLGLAVQSAIAFTLILRAFDILIGLIGIFVAFKFGAKWTIKKMIDDR